MGSTVPITGAHALSRLDNEAMERATGLDRNSPCYEVTRVLPANVDCKIPHDVRNGVFAPANNRHSCEPVPGNASWSMG